MDSNELSIGSIFSSAWKITTSKYFTLLKFWLVFFGVSFVFSIASSMVQDSWLMTMLIMALNIVVSLMVSLGIIRVILMIVRGEEPEFADMFVTDSKLILAYIGATIVMMVLVTLGFIFFVIPGIYLLLMWSQVPYGIVDKKLEAMQALSFSQDLTKGHRGMIFIFFLASMLINFGGALLLFIGLFVTLPWTAVAAYVLYERLLAQANAQGSVKPAVAAALPE